MNILELMRHRHSIRSYLDKEVTSDVQDVLNAYIERLNKRFDTNIQIFYNDPAFFDNSTKAYGNFSNCKNIIALVGKDEFQLGYVGELLVLKAEELGLNTCFVGLTYKKSQVSKRIKIGPKEKLYCSIALGYGANRGAQHVNKDISTLVSLEGEKPNNYDEVVEAALLAPTAINQQKFKVVFKDNSVSVIKRGIGFYIDMDLGIVQSHVDLITNKINLDLD